MYGKLFRFFYFFFNINKGNNWRCICKDISVSTRTVNFKMLVSELVNTTTDDEKNAPDFKCDDGIVIIR